MAEAAFLHKAVSLGFKVTKPWGDSERYDFVLDAGERLWRVQIKCTAAVYERGFRIQAPHGIYGKSGVAYTAEDVDVLAAYIVPLDMWYVVPLDALGRSTSLQLYPDGACQHARFEKYREAWDFFRGSGGRDLRAEADASTGAADGEPAVEWDRDPRRRVPLSLQ